MAMIMPMPAFLLDVLISANITLSVIVLLVSMHITRPVEFSVFPTTLLLLTLFRLALNISSSRLILIHGNTGTGAAGEVIEAFGNFVVGGNYIIGVVIFLVLIAIQYVVINHGAVRISEVTARFTLDALPGKQMSIDSDLNAGLIDEHQARARRKNLGAEAEFYGAMDGASRFTQRDAVASILITSINIGAGFLIGVLQNGMDMKRALSTYTVLTIGDGLVTVIPALMVSVSGGLIVTRTSSEERLGADVRRQVFGNPQPLMLAGGVLIAMAAFPGLPTVPFLTMGSGVAFAGWKLHQKIAAAEPSTPTTAPAQAKDNLEALLKVEPLAVEVGLGLVKMVEGGQNSPLLKRIAAIRRQIASDLGYLVPPVRVTDNLQLKANEYVVSVKGAEIGRFELIPSREMAIHPAASAHGVTQGNVKYTSVKPATSPSVPVIEGIAAHEPAFGIPAIWIAPETASHARSQGYTVVDVLSVLGTHLAELIRRHASELLSRQETKTIRGLCSLQSIDVYVMMDLDRPGVFAVQLLREEIRTPQRLPELHGSGVEGYRTARERHEAARDRPSNGRFAASDLRGHYPHLQQVWNNEHSATDSLGHRERIGRSDSAGYARNGRSEGSEGARESANQDGAYSASDRGVIYSEDAMGFTQDQENSLLKLLERPKTIAGLITKGIQDWATPIVAILGLGATLIVGLHYFVMPDLSALTEGVKGIHGDITRIDDDVKNANSRIDTLLNQALQRAFPAIPAPTKYRNQDYIRDGISKVQLVVAMAKDSDTILDKKEMEATSRRLVEATQADPNLAEVAWSATGSMLDYSSSLTRPLPLPVKWLGPAPELPGFPGLFGLTEMKNVQEFVSEVRVPLARASRLISLSAEQKTVEFLMSRGISEWPEFEKVVGGDGSNIVLDKLHLRNVVLEHINVVYGGGEAQLENVSFVDCTFKTVTFVRSERTIQLSKLVLQRQPVTMP